MSEIACSKTCGMRFIAGNSITINGTWAALFRLTAYELAASLLITTISGRSLRRYCYVIRYTNIACAIPRSSI